MRLKFALSFMLFLAVLMNYASTVTKRVYINRGVFNTSDSKSFMSLAFNSTTSYSQTNEVLELTTSDVLRLIVVNNDSVSHEIEVKGMQSSGSIAPNDSSQVDYTFTNEGVFIYRGVENYPVNTYLGLSGMIVVADHSYSKFYWNIKEHQKSINDSIEFQGSYDWQDYYPDYFTLNGQSAPNINDDPTARISGSVSENIYLYIINTGQSTHSLHFHGYHLEIIYSSKFPSHVGRSKDTFAIYDQEGLVLKLIPDKPGEFPVHDHNLIAVSGGGMYPIGRFLTMLIQ